MSTCTLEVRLYCLRRGLHSLAMHLYALGVVPLINALSDDFIKQVWYADDASACVSLMDPCQLWNRLVSIGPDFGNFPNPSKACLIVKDSLGF